MRFYQMDTASAAWELNTDPKNGRGDSVEQKEVGFLRRFWNLLCEADFFNRPGFTVVNIFTLVCFGISIIFALLNRSWALFRLSLAAICVGIILFFIEKIILAWYKNNYFERVKHSFQVVTVIRSGIEKRIRPDQLMLGDLLCLEEGDILYGDARIISCENLYADEKYVFSRTIPSAKFSEPIPIGNLPADQQHNMLWKGSFITSGRCKCIVTALGEECYVEKTGGRKAKKQRSLFYNKQNNISHIVVYGFLLLTGIFFLLSAFVTGRYVETFLAMGVMASLVAINPISSLMEWTYYRTAKKLAEKGVLIRNIEAFDGMNREKDLYFDAEKLIEGKLSFCKAEPFNGSEKSGLFYFSLCVGESVFSEAIQIPLQQYHEDFKELKRAISGCRLEKDTRGNYCGAFLNGERAVAAAAGYWADMLSLLQNTDEEMPDHIRELEQNGKMVWLVGASYLDFIPADLDFSQTGNKLSLVSLLVFDVQVDTEETEVIKQLHRASARMHLLCRYSEAFANTLTKLYNLDSVLLEMPNTTCYTLPHIKDQSLVADQSSSSIEKERANLVLTESVSPHRVIHQIKCMFCGIRRATNFLSLIGVFFIISAFVLLLREVPIESLVIPMLLMRFAVTLPCYSLIVCTRNCNQYKRSVLLGVFCGTVGFASALIGEGAALFSLQLSAILLSFYLLLRNRSFKSINKHELLFSAVVLIVASLPWFFIGANWLTVILLALFVPLAAFVLDLFY